jgi:hypothetical protein
MTLRHALLAAVLVLDGALFLNLRRLEAARAELLARKAEAETLSDSSLRADELRLRIGELLKRTTGVMPEQALDIALLRDSLIAAERGLDVDRISLDFRPSSSPPAGFVGGGVGATLRGSFRALHEYLGRVEAFRLPLAAEEITLRSEDNGRALLTIRFQAIWRIERPVDPMELTPGEVARLSAWLASEDVSARGLPGRHPFQRRADLAALAPRAAPEPPPPPEQSSAGYEPETPVLSGFVLARPELEADVSRRVLAALRFEGELRLLKVGDLVGGFRVERIDAPESVLLVDERTGEAFRLFLE